MQQFMMFQQMQQMQAGLSPAAVQMTVAPAFDAQQQLALQQQQAAAAAAAAQAQAEAEAAAAAANATQQALAFQQQQFQNFIMQQQQVPATPVATAYAPVLSPLTMQASPSARGAPPSPRAMLKQMSSGSPRAGSGSVMLMPDPSQGPAATTPRSASLVQRFGH